MVSSHMVEVTLFGYGNIYLPFDLQNASKELIQLFIF